MDWILENLTLEKASFQMVAVSGLLLLVLAALLHLLLKGFGFCYHYYVLCQKLRCFSEPPRVNWFLGHLGLVSMAAGNTLGLDHSTSRWLKGYFYGRRMLSISTCIAPCRFIALLACYILLIPVSIQNCKTG
uniref:Uncharacterized protein n=1 Tax=Anolis carolinensis TaxID=28377 RepID=A0A803SU17_ANOCA